MKTRFFGKELENAVDFLRAQSYALGGRWHPSLDKYLERDIVKVLYLIGSLRNKRVPELAKTLRREFAARGENVEVFDDWYAAGPEADDYWKEYEQARGHEYKEALEGHAAKNVFAFDKRNLDRATHVVLVLPAGKSGHMEVMYGKYGAKAKAAILLDPEDVRWDVMYQFVDAVLDKDSDVVDFVLDD